MRLTREDNLHGTLFVVDESQHAFRICQQQVPALVTCNTTREANRQRRGVKHRLSSFDVVSTFSGSYSRLTRSMADERNQPFLQTGVSVPQFLVRDSRYCFSPQVMVAKLCFPIVAKMILNEKSQERRDPGRRMNSVSHVADRNLFTFLVRPDLLPQGS